MPIFVAWTLLTHATNIFIHAKNPDSSSENNHVWLEFGGLNS
jgi:hypothetical protein